MASTGTFGNNPGSLPGFYEANASAGYVVGAQFTAPTTGKIYQLTARYAAYALNPGDSWLCVWDNAGNILASAYQVDSTSYATYTHALSCAITSGTTYWLGFYTVGGVNFQTGGAGSSSVGGNAGGEAPRTFTGASSIGQSAPVVYASFYYAPGFATFSPSTTTTGTTVTCTGSNYSAGGVSVSVGGVSIPSVIVDSDTQLHFTIPANCPTGTITITTNGGAITSSSTLHITPTISGVAPTVAPPGATTVVSGSGFTQVSSVTVNGTSASYTVNSSSQITVTVPSGAGGAGSIVVTTTGGSVTYSGFTAGQIYYGTGSAVAAIAAVWYGDASGSGVPHKVVGVWVPNGSGGVKRVW